MLKLVGVVMVGMIGCASNAKLIGPDTYTLRPHGTDSEEVGNAYADGYRVCPAGFDVVAVTDPQKQVPAVIRCNPNAQMHTAPPE